MDEKERRDKNTEEVVESEEEVPEGSKEPKGEEQALLQQIRDLEDKYRRALADYQNLQRRTIDEKREWAKLSNKDLILKLLPILDTLMLAEKHTKDQNFVLTVQQFLSILEQDGVKRIKTVGEEFDPRLMECVTTQKGEANKVLEEVRAGYTLYDQVLRTAQVVVGQKLAHSD